LPTKQTEQSTISATETRQDVYDDYTSTAVVFEVQVTCARNSCKSEHNPPRRTEHYAKLPAKHHRGKPTTIIIVHTDGKPPRNLTAEGFRGNPGEEGTRNNSILSNENLELTLKAAKRIAKEDKARPTLKNY